MTTQKVFRLTGQTGLDNLHVVEEPIGTIDKYEVLIKVRSVSLNFRDIAIATGKYPFSVKENLVPCSDVAGDIVEVGSRAGSGLKRGDRVIATFDPDTQYGPIRTWSTALGGPLDGVLKEYLVLPASAVIKVPRSSTLSYSQWASLVCTGATVWNSLYSVQPITPGQTVLFLGTGGVSITGLVLAKAAGAVTIITSSSDEKLKYVKEKYGVDHTINYKQTPNWGAEVQRLTNNRGVDYILENGGSGTIAQSLEAIAVGGVIAVVGFLSAAPQSQMPDIASLALAKGCVVRGIIIGSRELTEQVVRFVGEHNLDIPVEKVFGFSQEEVIKAYKYLAEGQHVGKICIELP